MVNETDSLGMTALMHAAGNNHEMTVRTLLAVPGVEAWVETSNGDKDAMGIALSRGCLECTFAIWEDSPQVSHRAYHWYSVFLLYFRACSVL